ncbi:glycerophosphodiester phosphodiesterase family protein [Chryseobacterium sp.]|uniref:glycerophosphodiester phosphodiesterase family protein n=1 Tax=Chryseobacterium sp. TaxID=1871047 RepID=UPI0031D732FA
MTFKISAILISIFSMLSSCSESYDISKESFSTPMIIAHRGGKVDFPENTILSFEKALEAGVDAIEMDVQVSKDNIPVLYHPNNLNRWTNGTGKVEEYTLAELKKLNAAWNYDEENGYPYRKQPQEIPTLREALHAIPVNRLIMLDMKSLPAAVLVQSIAAVLEEYNAWERVVFYSTSEEHHEALKIWPKARMFETREITRKRLLEYKINGVFWEPGKPASWVGYELRRDFDINEVLTLGLGNPPITITLWDKMLVKSIKNESCSPKIVLMGINTGEDYERAAELGGDAVLTDAPFLLINERKAFLNKKAE